MTYTIDSEFGGEIIQGDCLEVAESIEPGSVDLIVTDPPYGTVQGIGESEEIQHGMKGKTEWDTALDPCDILNITERLLRKNGKAILFAQEPYTSELITNAKTNLPFSYRMAWVKDHFANSLIAKHSPVNLFEDIIVFTKEYDGSQNYPLREYFKHLFESVGLTKSEIINRIGQEADHCFRFDSTQFALCTRKTYRELIAEFGIDQMAGFKPYNELDEMRAESTFNLPDGEKYKTNVFEYDKPQSDYHPTQKPVPLLMDLIETFSNEGDRVVDLTAGSGSTAIAAYKTNRECIAIEKDETYYQKAVERMSGIDDSRVSVTGQYNLEAYND